MKWQVNGPVPRVYQATVDGVLYQGISPKEVLLRYAQERWDRGELLPEDWQEPVWRALAESHPGHVRRVPGKASDGISVPRAMSFLSFLIKRLRNREFVSESVAQARAAVCRQCPKAEPVLGCSICKDALRSVIEPPIALAIPEGCGACGCWLPAKAWIPRSLLGELGDHDFWERCWMRSEESAGSPGDSPGQTNG